MLKHLTSDTIANVMVMPLLHVSTVVAAHENNIGPGPTERQGRVEVAFFLFSVTMSRHPPRRRAISRLFPHPINPGLSCMFSRFPRVQRRTRAKVSSPFGLHIHPWCAALLNEAATSGLRYLSSCFDLIHDHLCLHVISAETVFARALLFSMYRVRRDGDGRRRLQPSDDGERAALVPVRAPRVAQAAGHAQVVVQRLARGLRRGRQGLVRVRAHHAPGLLPLQAPPSRSRHQPRHRRGAEHWSPRGRRRRRREAPRARGPGNGARRRSGGQVAVSEVK